MAIWLRRARRSDWDKPCLFSKPVEFDGIKIGVVDVLPDAEEFNGVAVAQPAADQIVAGVRIPVTGDVRQADIVLLIDAGKTDLAGKDFDRFVTRQTVLFCRGCERVAGFPETGFLECASLLARPVLSVPVRAYSAERLWRHCEPV